MRAGERVARRGRRSGNAGFAAARRFAEVTSTDYVPRCSRRVAPRRRRRPGRALPGRRRRGSPFGDGSFDVVLSTFGAMFTPDHGRPARGCCASPGTAGASGWRTDARRLHVQGRRRYVRPGGAQVPGPVGHRVAHRRAVRPEGRTDPLRRRLFNFRYRSAAHWIRCSATTQADFRPSPRSTRRAGCTERDIASLLEDEHRRLVVARRPRRVPRIVVTKR